MIGVLRRRCAAEIAASRVSALAGPLEAVRGALAARAPFDAVVSNFAVFSTIERLDQVFRLLGGLVRPGGALIVSIQNPWYPGDMRHAAFWRALLAAPLTGVIRYRSAELRHVHRYTRGQLRRAARPEFEPDTRPAPDCGKASFGPRSAFPPRGAATDMRRLLRDLVAGQPLRHRPVALPPADQQPVRAFAESPGGEREVTAALFAVSLAPLLLGLARGTGGPVTGRTIVRMRDGRERRVAGDTEREPAGLFAHPGGALDLLRPIAASVHCVPALARGWRYARAWRHARRTARRPHAFAMKFKDLCALNVFYMMPRPSTSSAWSMATPATCSRWISWVRWRAWLSPGAAPDQPVGRAHARERTHRGERGAGRVEGVGVSPRRSPSHSDARMGHAAGPHRTLAGARHTRAARRARPARLAVERCEAVGSHMLFATSIVAHSAQRDAPQLCHVSDMYARWRVARGEPLTDA
jgi:hypothetical protein